jgi:uncharacterized phage-associated protein
MYEARKICNFLIAHGKGRSFPITNLRLNKLLYFIHGWALTSRPEGLVRNHFLAWELGPVVRPVYDAFKHYREREITELARFFDYSSGETRVLGFEDLPEGDVQLIKRVVESYDEFSTGELVKMSHAQGGPWDTIYAACLRDPGANPRIPNDLIRNHFLAQAGGDIRH